MRCEVIRQLVGLLPSRPEDEIDRVRADVAALIGSGEEVAVGPLLGRDFRPVLDDEMVKGERSRAGDGDGATLGLGDANTHAIIGVADVFDLHEAQLTAAHAAVRQHPVNQVVSMLDEVCAERIDL